MTEYVRNLWYMAAWEEEVPEGGFLSRKLLDLPWLVLRAEDGSYAMLRDRCPHRFVALSKGRREGDVLHCGYHGLGFDLAGACVHNPFGGATPPGARVATMPAVARHGAVWFWPGDPALADPATIPDFAFCTGPDHGRAWLRMDAGFELIADNLMDLSHAEFIHRETFGVNGSLLTCGKQSVVEDESGAIWNNWDITNAVPPDWAAPSLPAGARIDQWLHMRWHAPAAMALHIGIARTGEGEAGLLFPPMANPHILTPETATSTHYFFTHEPGDAGRAMAMKVFLEEDEPMVSSAQEGMGGEDFWALKPAILPSDAGAIRTRRRLMQLRRAEAREDADPA